MIRYSSDSNRMQPGRARAFAKLAYERSESTGGAIPLFAWDSRLGLNCNNDTCQFANKLLYSNCELRFKSESRKLLHVD